MKNDLRLFSHLPSMPVNMACAELRALSRSLFAKCLSKLAAHSWRVIQKMARARSHLTVYSCASRHLPRSLFPSFSEFLPRPSCLFFWCSRSKTLNLPGTRKQMRILCIDRSIHLFRSYDSGQREKFICVA